MTENQSDKPGIILVDRSPASMRQLGRLCTEILHCDLLMYDNPKDALQSIATEQPELVVMEWDLPRVIIEEFIKSLKTHPSLKDIPIIICTVNQEEINKRLALKLGVHAYFIKPINRREFRECLTKLFPNARKSSNGEYASWSRGDSFEAELRDIAQLGPLPSLVERILSITGDPNSSAHQLTQAIRLDAAISAKILKIVNSAYYGFYREIGNIDHAVVILGFDEIVNITIATCIIQNYSDGVLPDFDRNEFWLHSIGVGYIARSLRNHMPDIISRDAFTIGLLHDLGKIILAQYFPEKFSAALREAHKQQKPLNVVTKESLGWNHAEVGGFIADNWNLPPQLVRAIRYHHSPVTAGEFELTIHLTHLSNYLSHRYGIGFSGNPAPDEVNPKTLEVFGLKDKDIDEVWKTLNIDVDVLRKILNSVIS